MDIVFVCASVLQIPGIEAMHNDRSGGASFIQNLSVSGHDCITYDSAIPVPSQPLASTTLKMEL
jgi:hypothetical protein